MDALEVDAERLQALMDAIEGQQGVFCLTSLCPACSEGMITVAGIMRWPDPEAAATCDTCGTTIDIDVQLDEPDEVVLEITNGAPVVFKHWAN